MKYSSLCELITAADELPSEHEADLELNGGAPDLASCLKAVELSPDSAAAHYRLGVILQKQGKLDDAESAYRKSIKLNYNNANAHNNLGIVLALQGRLDEAILSYISARQQAETSPGPYYNMALSFYKKGDRDSAITHFKLAILYDPKLALAHRGLGNALYWQGNTAEAKKHLEIAAGLGDKPAVKKLEKIKEDETKQTAQAHETAKKSSLRENIIAAIFAASIVAPLAGAAMYFGSKKAEEQQLRNTCTALNLQGKHTEAEAACKKFIARYSDDAMVYNDLGLALSGQDKLGDAVSACKKAIELNPDFAIAYCNLGLAYYKQEDFNAAVGAYSKSIAVNPRNDFAHSGLGSALFSQEKFDEAETAYKKAIELSPNTPFYHNQLGNVLNAHARYGEAESAYLRAIRLNPQDADSHSNLAYVLEKQKKIVEAMKHYKIAADLGDVISKIKIEELNKGAVK